MKVNAAVSSLPENQKELENDYLSNLCRRCFGNRLGDNNSGDIVCFNCGLVQGVVFDINVEWWQLRVKTYQRVFYFNERCSRWLCNEPKIDDESWGVIYNTANTYIRERDIKNIDREVVNKILKSVKITKEFAEKNRSKKFKCTKMSPKRFFDKYSEKWKTIIWKLTGKRPPLPHPDLVALIKRLFGECQKPFENARHAKDCDKRSQCDRYFECWHNFINYDYVFRKLLQIAEVKFGWNGAYRQFGKEFPLVSKKIRDKKLRPMFQKICTYNEWPCPSDE